MPLPFLADAHGIGVVELDLRRGVGAVAELVLQPLEMQRVDRAVGPKARHEETGQPARRLRQHQERVAHRRRHEPFVAGDRGSRRRRGSARVVLARTSVPPCFSVMPMPSVMPDLLRPRPEARVVVARRRFSASAAPRSAGSAASARDRGARHGDRAHVPVLDLRHHVDSAPRARPRPAPRRACRRRCQVEACSPSRMLSAMKW